MKTQNIPGSYKRCSRRLKAATLLLLAPLFLMLSPQVALGQGFKMTQLNASGNTTGTFPNGVNSNQDVVGSYANSSGAVVGFLYARGKLTTLTYPGSDNLTRDGWLTQKPPFGGLAHLCVFCKGGTWSHVTGFHRPARARPSGRCGETSSSPLRLLFLPAS
jgi:hypothetical protein